MIDRQLKKMIEKYPMALATVGKNKNPHVIAIAYVKVVGKNRILITDNYMQRTKENLIRNNKVALAVWDKNWNGYQMKGVAHYYTSGKWKNFVERIKENKGLPVKGAILVTLNEIRELM